MQTGRIRDFVALDQDEASLKVVARDYAHLGIRTVDGSVRQILSGKPNPGQFDFVYAAGLFDYLNAPVAAALTRRMFDMTRPGGLMLIPNFLTGVRDCGYMEAFMDWHLIYRITPICGHWPPRFPPATWPAAGSSRTAMTQLSSCSYQRQGNHPRSGPASRRHLEVLDYVDATRAQIRTDKLPKSQLPRPFVIPTQNPESAQRVPAACPADTGHHLQWNMFGMQEVERPAPFWWRRSITVSMASLTRLSGLIPASRRYRVRARRRSAKTSGMRSGASVCRSVAGRSERNMRRSSR